MPLQPIDWKSVCSEVAAPNSKAAAATPSGRHRPSTTIAIAIKPRPADIPSTNVPACASTRVAPARPAIAPAKSTAYNCVRFGEIPAAMAAGGDSPTARSASPAWVRCIHHANSGAIRYSA